MTFVKFTISYHALEILQWFLNYKSFPKLSMPEVKESKGDFLVNKFWKFLKWMNLRYNVIKIFKISDRWIIFIPILTF